MGWLISIIAGGGLIGSILLLIDRGDPKSLSEYILHLTPKVTIGVLFGAFMYWYIVTLLQVSTRNKLRRMEVQLSKFGSEELQEKIEENFFTKLVQINFKYIDHITYRRKSRLIKVLD